MKKAGPHSWTQFFTLRFAQRFVAQARTADGRPPRPWAPGFRGRPWNQAQPGGPSAPDARDREGAGGTMVTGSMLMEAVVEGGQATDALGGEPPGGKAAAAVVRGCLPAPRRPGSLDVLAVALTRAVAEHLVGLAVALRCAAPGSRAVPRVRCPRRWPADRRHALLDPHPECDSEAK